MCKDNIDARKLSVMRQNRFLRRFLILFSVVLALFALALVCALLSAFFELPRLLLPYIEFMFDFTPVTGFVVAEMYRRSTVNPDTENLRPYSWREIFQCLKN